MKKILLPALLVTIAVVLVLPAVTSYLRVYPYSIEGSWLSQIQFVKEYWPKIWWNPYWFLGYPTSYSSSPLFVFGLGLVCRVFAQVEIFRICRLVAGLSFCLVPAVIYIFFRDLGFKKISAFVGACWFILGPSLFFLFPQIFSLGKEVKFLPFSIFSTYALGNIPRMAAFPLAVLALIALKKFLKKGSRRNLITLVIVVPLAVLTSSSIVTFLLVGGVSLLLSEMLSCQGSWKDQLAKALFAFLCCCLLLGVWYTPEYWFHSLKASSLGGNSLFSVLRFLFNLIVTFVPVLIGIWWVKGRRWAKIPRLTFVLWFNLGFWFLTLSRFVADFDFWQDYTAYGVEMDLGVAMLIGILSEKLFISYSMMPRKNKRSAGFSFGGINPTLAGYLLTTCCLLLFLWRTNCVIRGRLFDQYGTYYADSFEYGLSNFLAENVRPTERVFVSGSLTFWLNYFSPQVMQVRGGDEPASVHPYWAHGSYQIREGTDSELTDLWLRVLGASWVVVHTPVSADLYDDFKYPLKFEQMDSWRKVFEKEGNRVYRLLDNQNLFGNIIEADTLGYLSKPQDGEDKLALQKYVTSRYRFTPRQFQVEILDNQTIVVDTPFSGEYQAGISQTYTHRWHLLAPSDRALGGDVLPDPLGNIILKPTKMNMPVELKLVYERYGTEWFLRGLLFFGGITLVLAYPHSFIWFRENIFELDIIGLGEEDDY